MGLKSRQAAGTAKASTKSNTAKNNNVGDTAPPGSMEGVLTPRVPTASDSCETSSLTPYQRMKQLLATRAATPNTIAAVEDLQQFLLKGPKSEDKVTIRMKLLWISDHTYKQWQLVRLHLVDAGSPESLDDMLNVFYSSYDANHQDVDSVLLTVTVWNVESGSNLLPPPGAVVTITNYSNLQLYQDTQCQLTARLSQLTWEDAQHHRLDDTLGSMFKLLRRLIIKSAVSHQMTKRRGSSNYSDDEVQWLLELVGSHVPKTMTDWEALAMVYNRKKNVRSATRNAVSLKRKLRNVRARQGTAAVHTGISPPTSSTPKNPTPSRELVQLSKLPEKVGNSSKSPEHATTHVDTFASSQDEGPLKSLSHFNELKRQWEYQEQQRVQRVLALVHRRLNKILETHRRAERRHRRALRDCITSLTVTIEQTSAQQTEE